MDVTKRFPGVRLLIKARHVMITMSCHNFSIFVNLDFGCAIAYLNTVVTAPIGRNLFPNILTVELETFMVDGSIECGVFVLFIVIHVIQKSIFDIKK